MCVCVCVCAREMQWLVQQLKKILKLAATTSNCIEFLWSQRALFSQSNPYFIPRKALPVCSRKEEKERKKEKQKRERKKSVRRLNRKEQTDPTSEGFCVFCLLFCSQRSG